MKNKKSKSNRKKAKTVVQKPQQEAIAIPKNDVITSQNNHPKENTPQAQQTVVFSKKNYTFMFIGLAVIALGFILMAGGGSEDPNVFNEAIFSIRRIHIAPMVVVIGFAIEVYAILLNPDS